MGTLDILTKIRRDRDDDERLLAAMRRDMIERERELLLATGIDTPGHVWILSADKASLSGRCSLCGAVAYFASWPWGDPDPGLIAELVVPWVGEPVFAAGRSGEPRPAAACPFLAAASADVLPERLIAGDVLGRG